MQTANNLSLPETLAELVDPKRTGLLVYDMQAGIVPFVQEGGRVKDAVSALARRARQRGVPVFFSRHFAVPMRIAGLAQMRSAMRFQRISRAEDLKPHLLQGSPEYQLVPEMEPGPNDMVFDKLGMSFFVGTPLEFCLRDLGIISVIVVGCVAEIGIEPTVMHAIDLGFLTVTVADACGSVNVTNHSKVMDNLGKTGLVTNSQSILEVWNE
jgi:nicotinamidase-related amidase